MSEDTNEDAVLMTAPVKPGVAEKFREIAKSKGMPIRVLGGMLYENFIEEHEAGKVFVMPAQLGKQPEPEGRPKSKRKPAAK